MFDWIGSLFVTLTVDAWLLYVGGLAVGIALGVELHMTWCKMRAARQDEKERQADIEARIAQCPDEIEAEKVKEMWERLLESCDLKGL